MVSRSGLQSAPVTVSVPGGFAPARPQSTAQQAAVVQQQVRSAMEQADRKATTAATPSAARDAVKAAQRALDAARRMRGPAKERASLVHELERKLDDVKRKATVATDSHQQGERAAAGASRQAEVWSAQAADRLDRTLLGVPVHRVRQVSVPPATDPNPDAKRQALVASLPLPIASDLAVDRVEHLSLDHPLAPSDLKPKTAYVYGENVYVTDENGDAAYMRGVARYVPDALRHDSIQVQVGRDGQVQAGERFGKLEGGHIGGVSLGGYPSGPNLFAQNSNMNRGAFASYERQFRELAKNDKRVEYEVRLAVDFPGDKLASVAILRYWVDGIEQEESPLLNEAHQFR